MPDTTYYRWVAHELPTEPDWGAASSHIEQLAHTAIRNSAGTLADWAYVDEVLAFPDDLEDADEEVERVHAQLAEDLEALQGGWEGRRNDATCIDRDTERILLSGGWPIENDYPTDMSGAIARLVGSGAASAAGFQTDEDAST